MDLCHGKLSRIELGQLPGRFELEAFLDRYGVLYDDWAPYVDIWRLAKQKYWWSGLGLDSTFLSMEHEACLIRDYQTTRIPVLLQTEQHARKLLPTTLSTDAAERAHKEVSCLKQRQAQLDADNAPTLHFLLYQPLLHAGVANEQLKHLLQRNAPPPLVPAHRDGTEPRVVRSVSEEGTQRVRLPKVMLRVVSLRFVVVSG